MTKTILFLLLSVCPGRLPAASTEEAPPTPAERRQRCESTQGQWVKGRCQCAGGLAELADRCVPAAHKVGDRTPLVADLYNVYSPSLLTHEVVAADGKKSSVTSMWTAGWLTEKDIGADNIYYSELVKGRWSRPVLSFRKPGFHVNDPSVIDHPKQKWLFMYYTALDDRNATEEFMTLRNWVGFASSIDGGKTWTDHGVIIGQDNGLDKTGAWSPSALVVDNEIWVYYHTNSKDFSKPISFRTRFSLNGWEKIGKTERLIFPDDRFAEVTLLSNLDVVKAGEAFIMVANKTSLDRIVRYISRDGLTWYREPREPLITAGTGQLVLTPHLEFIDAGHYRVLFGYHTDGRSGSIQAWDFSR